MNDITVLMPTSPVPSNPSTEIIENTIASVRYHLPEAPILILMDGMRQEQWERSDTRRNYREFKDNLILAMSKDERVYFTEFSKHTHQAEMTRYILGGVGAPLVLFVEHDTPLVRQPIDWDGIGRTILSGWVNYVRFHHIDHWEPLHEYLMRGKIDPCGVPLIKTVQWSQRPHVASTAFYRELMKQFRPGCRTMIEDFIYDYVAEGPWEKYKLAIYAPMEGGIQRSLHTDARGSDPKFPMEF